MQLGIAHSDPIAPVILGVTGILAFAILGRVGARRLGQPTVVGELLMGILIGNVGYLLGIDLIALLREGPQVFELVHEALSCESMEQAAISIFGPEVGAQLTGILMGPRGGELMQVAHAVDTFSRYGVIFMLFMVGLKTNVDELRTVGKDSARVALLGVALPFALGMAVVWLMRPTLELGSSLFIAATLGATSIGITANVLDELDYGKSREGRIILGAAVYDDILGLIILAIVSGIVVTGSVAIGEMIQVVVVSAAFLAAVISLGPRIVRISASIMQRLDFVEAKMFTSLEVILVPIFFILIGIQVKIETFVSIPVATVALGLLVAAILGKLACGIGAARPANKLVIGIGMVPRGEVGLVFAAIGRTLGVIDDSMFAAVVLMVIITSLIAPPWLKVAVGNREQQAT
jgi:Kef-type K+ transport system membrane component KefB